MLEYQSVKTFLLKDILQIDQMKILLLAKWKVQFHGVFTDLNGKEIIGTFYEKEMQKTNQK